MTKNRKQRPAKLGAVFLILAMAAALLSGSALAALPESDVYETITQGVDSYVQLTSFYEYTVYTYELYTGSGPPGMDFLESGDTLGLAGTPMQPGTYIGSGTVYYQSNDGEPDEQAPFSFTITVEAAEAPDEPINQNTHDHTFHSDWSYDEEAHWHECDCGSRDGYEPHRISDWATGSDGSLLGVCDVCGASVFSVGDMTAAPKAPPTATPKSTPEKPTLGGSTPEAKEKPTLGGDKTESKKGSLVTVLLVVLLVVLLLLLGTIALFLLRSRKVAQTAPRAERSRLKPENESYAPRRDHIGDASDRWEYEWHESAERDDSVQ